MPRVPLAIPPGVVRQGTESQSAGHWYDTYLVRWVGGNLAPVGGWASRGSGTVTGMARAMLPWKDNSSVTRIAIGTHSKLYVSDRGGALYDITPVGFTAGRADAVASGGYGTGGYGTGTYGTPRSDSTLIQDATQWTLDTFGQYLLGISPDDGKLYKWTLNTATPAAQISGSPTGTAVVVTDEGFIFVLATTDPRTLSWCDQRDDSVWTPSSTNQAGDFTFQTPGRLMCGKTFQGGTLILTDQDAWVATYEPTTLVYGFEKKGDACGAISRQCAVSFDMQVAWMSQSGFWRYNGYVTPIPCDVWDYIVQDFNTLQASKIFGAHNSQFHEIEWRYCSSGSTEIDRCVVWNYQDNTWVIGRVARTCAADKRAGFLYPVAVDSSGTVYNHEVGYGYDGTMPYAEGGPIKLANGDTVMCATQLFPDDLTAGDVSATFYVKNNPDDNYTTYGPYSLASQTDVRFTGRQVKIRYTGVNLAAWRVGTPALDVKQGGNR